MGAFTVLSVVWVDLKSRGLSFRGSDPVVCHSLWVLLRACCHGVLAGFFWEIYVLSSIPCPLLLSPFLFIFGYPISKVQYHFSSGTITVHLRSFFSFLSWLWFSSWLMGNRWTEYLTTALRLLSFMNASISNISSSFYFTNPLGFLVVGFFSFLSLVSHRTVFRASTPMFLVGLVPDITRLLSRA